MGISIVDEIKKEQAKGFDYRHAESLVAQEMLLDKIAHSRMKDSITLKGGVVMFKKTGNARRATIDMDIDVIRYSIDDKSIDGFVSALNHQNDGIKVSRTGSIEKLHQEDYEGRRIHLSLTDEQNHSVGIKMDIGVHTLYAVEQESCSFFISPTNESVSILVNPNEQIFGEKILSLARHGIVSTRYKDIADMYFFVSGGLLDKNKLARFFSACLPNKYAQTMTDVYLRVSDTFHNRLFSALASEKTNEWCDASYEEMVDSILGFLERI